MFLQPMLQRDRMIFDGAVAPNFHFEINSLRTIHDDTSTGPSTPARRRLLAKQVFRSPSLRMTDLEMGDGPFDKLKTGADRRYNCSSLVAHSLILSKLNS